MKLILLILCSVTVHCTVAVFNVQNNCRGFNAGQTHSQILPNTNRDKCLYECMLRTAGMVKKDGLIKVEKFVDFLKKSKEYDNASLTKIAAVLEKCKNHKHFSEDKCETVGLLVQCATEEAKKSSLDQISVLNAIRFPFYSKQSIDKWNNLNQIVGIGR